MKQLKKALQKAGFKASASLKHPQTRYRILHIPTAQYLCHGKLGRRPNKGWGFITTEPVIAKNRAVAGKMRDCVFWHERPFAYGDGQNQWFGHYDGKVLLGFDEPIPPHMMTKQSFEFIPVNEEEECKES